jgi:4-hydroxy-tetrahydrodipicolinate synthase
LPLAEALFSEASPIPSKAALAMMGKIAPDIRLPLHAMSEPGKAKLRALLSQLGLAK